MINRRPSHTSPRSLTGSPYARGTSVYYGSAGSRQPSEPPAKRHRYRRKGSLLLIMVVVLFGLHIFWAKQASAEVAAAHEQQLIMARQRAATFTRQVNGLIAANPAVTFNVVTDSEADGVQQYGADTTFDGASTGKLLTAADYLRHVQDGTATLDQSIDGQSAEQWLQAMLVNSDDTAWAELNGYLTHDDLQDYANSIGFTDYNPSVNTFTARDVAVLLQKLYSGSLLDPANRSLMLRYLAQANYRGYIVAAVPSSDMVYHKIGMDNDTVNDGAIITHGQQYVVLVIFTDGNGTYDWGTRAQLMQTITQDAITAYL
jgi:beta-lactamase class A